MPRLALTLKSVQIVGALLFALAFAFIGSIPLTGPIAILVLSRSLEGRFREAMAIGVGAAVAEGLYAGIAFFGFHSLVHDAAVKGIADGVSGLVLVALGLYFLRWRFHEKTCREAHGRALWTGFSISLLNPTLLVTWTVAVAALSNHVGMPSRLLAVPFGLGAAVGVASWELLFVAGVRRFGDRFSRRFLKGLVRGVGAALVALGLYAGVKSFRTLHAPPGHASAAGRRASAVSPSSGA